MTTPKFIGIGAQKAGTTWWWALLSGHPEIDAVELRDGNLSVRTGDYGALTRVVATAARRAGASLLELVEGILALALAPGEPLEQ